MALVSILTPCFNARPFILETVRKALGQSRCEIEVIVVDDGSTDGSFEAIRAIDAPRLRVLPANGKGAAAARNQAFSASSGKFVLYLDADDLIDSNHVALLEGRLADCAACVAMGEWDRFRRDPSEARFPARHNYVDAPGPEWLALTWMPGQSMTQCGMALIPRDLIEKHGGWDERLSLNDDFEFFARILSRCDGVRHAPGARLYYRSGLTSSLSGQRSRKAVESEFLSIELGTGHLLAAADNARTRQACANIFKAFEYDQHPYHPDLCARARARVTALGGSDLEPDGPPNFHRLRTLVGWRLARRVQRTFGR